MFRAYKNLPEEEISDIMGWVFCSIFKEQSEMNNIKVSEEASC